MSLRLERSNDIRYLVKVSKVLGRMGADEAVRQIQGRERRRLEQEQERQSAK